MTTDSAAATNSSTSSTKKNRKFSQLWCRCRSPSATRVRERAGASGRTSSSSDRRGSQETRRTSALAVVEDEDEERDEEQQASSAARESRQTGGAGAPSALVTQVDRGAELDFDPNNFSHSEMEELIALHNTFPPIRLGPQRPPDVGKKTLILDLDETLVHSSFERFPSAAFAFAVELEGVFYEISVAVRPGVQEFLRFCSNFYEIVIFTASLAKYAKPLLDRIDPGGLCRHRLYRESCLMWRGNYIKDLSKLDRDIRQIVIVDNSPISSMLQVYNCIPIRTWFDDQSDRELYELMPILEALSSVDNIQTVLKRNGLDEPVASPLFGFVAGRSY